MTTETKEIVIFATAKAKPGKEDELERALREAAVPTREQRGCLQFELFRSAQDLAVITAFEHWASREDHDRHLRGEHIKILMARFEGILAGPPEIAMMKPL